jgi:carboxypeptidase PM20D1
LLFRWPGHSDERPLALMAHQDVVPVDGSMPWTHPAFAGIIEDGVLWGRGTLDDKGALVAICEAVERLLAEGFVPAHDVWLSFGAREEVSGPDAAAAVRALTERGVRPWLVVDEGGAIATGAFPGVAAPLGVVGIGEKGTTSLLLRAEGRGGHSSTPLPNGPTTRIARAVLRLERHQFPPRLTAPVIELLKRLAPQMPAPVRPLLTNADKLRAVLPRIITLLGPEAASMVRTSIAVTQLSGSPAQNVIASSASATVNLRIAPGDTVESSIAHVRKAIDDSGMSIDVLDANEPSPISRIDDEGYALMESTISTTFPEAVVTPYLMMAATDSRFFAQACDRVFRFAPFLMSQEQRESIHSYDERIGIDDFVRGIGWYRLLIEQHR